MQISQFTIYESATGRVVTSGTASLPDEGFPDNAIGAGNAVLMGVSTDKPGVHYVEAGEIVAMPERPSESHEWDYAAKAWVSNDENAWGLVRIERDRLLRSTDWRVTKATETGAPMDPAWSAYRQALRDVTGQPDPHAIVWPEPPSN